MDSLAADLNESSEMMKSSIRGIENQKVLVVWLFFPIKNNCVKDDVSA